MCRSPGSVQTTYLFPLVFTYEWELISAYIVSAAKTRDWYYLYLKERLKNVEAVRLMPFDSVVVCVLRTGPWSSLLDDPSPLEASYGLSFPGALGAALEHVVLCFRSSGWPRFLL